MTAMAPPMMTASVAGSCTDGVSSPPLKPRPRVQSVQAASGNAGHANHSRFLRRTPGSARAPRVASGPTQSVQDCAAHHVARSAGRESRARPAMRRRAALPRRRRSRRRSHNRACGSSPSAQAGPPAVKPSQSGPMNPARKKCDGGAPARGVRRRRCSGAGPARIRTGRARRPASARARARAGGRDPTVRPSPRRAAAPASSGNARPNSSRAWRRARTSVSASSSPAARRAASGGARTPRKMLAVAAASP